MPWCPKCKNEYYDTVKSCPECGCELVENLNDVIEAEPLMTGEKEEIERMFSFLQYNDLHSVTIDYQEETEDYLLSSSRDEVKKATSLLKIFLEQEQNDVETENFIEENQEYFNEENELEASFGQQISDSEEPTYVYKNNAERAEDNKSSAYILLIVGGIGLVCDILMLVGVIPMPMLNAKYMILGVMGAMFLLFLVMGVVSFKSARRYGQQAKEEEDLTNSIKEWCASNLSAAAIEENLFTEAESISMAEEQKYFKRYDKIKEIVGNKFLNLDPAYLDQFADEYYSEIFPQ